MGFLSGAKNVVGAVPGVGSLVTGGNGLGILNSFMGKKDKGASSGYLPLHAVQEKALGKYSDLLDVNTDKIADTSIANQERQIRTNLADSERKAKELVAQRGLGRSSVGLNAILGASKDMGNQIGQVRSSLPALQYDMRTANLGNASQGIGNILNSRAYIQGNPGAGRAGGLLPLLGLGAGAMAGGAPGAMVGASAGSMMNQMG